MIIEHRRQAAVSILKHSGHPSAERDSLRSLLLFDDVPPSLVMRHFCVVNELLLGMSCEARLGAKLC